MNYAIDLADLAAVHSSFPPAVPVSRGGVGELLHSKKYSCMSKQCAYQTFAYGIKFGTPGHTKMWNVSLEINSCFFFFFFFFEWELSESTFLCLASHLLRKGLQNVVQRR